MNPEMMKTNKMKNSWAGPLFIRPAAGAPAPVEPEDFARFEGEGGPEAPVPNLVDVPLDNAIGRRPRRGYIQLAARESEN
jgi:hypothetical protein